MGSLLRAIQSLYPQSESCVRVLGSKSDLFQVWEFTVSERALRQTSATRLRSYDSVSAAHHRPILEQGHG